MTHPTQSRAEQLADAIDRNQPSMAMKSIAAELRRLSAVEAERDELREQLSGAHDLINSQVAVLDARGARCLDLATEVDALMARVAQLEAERQWLPIESAPKDGTVIALRRGQSVHSGRWARGTYTTGWLSLDSDAVFAFGKINPPTHWMPLPPPPTQGEVKNGS